MIYKNGEAIKLTPVEKKNILEKFKKWPIRIIKPKERITKNPKNTKDDEPNSLTFPTKAVVKNSTHGVNVYQYAENVRIDDNGNNRYSPPHLQLRGPMVLGQEDYELVWWLVYCCPYLKGGENYRGKNPKCEIEDLASDAEIKVELRKKEAEYNTILYSEELGLDEEKLRAIAKALYINGVDDMTTSQARIAVDNQVRRDKKDGIDKFLELTNSEQTIKIKGMLQSAIDKKIIIFEVKNKRWSWVTENGKNNDPITSTGNKQPMVALFDYYTANQTFAESLYDAVKAVEIEMPDNE